MAAVLNEKDGVLFDVSPDSSKNRIYPFATGALYTGPHRDKTRKSALGPCITLAIQDGTFELGTAGAPERRVAAAVLRPLARHTICARESIVAVALVGPDHPYFRHFLALPVNEPLVLARETFERCSWAFDDVLKGQLKAKVAHQFFESIVQTVAERFPPPAPLDPRVQHAVERLRENLDLSLDDLANSVHLSYHRLSHLFSESLGLPLRSYRSWQRMCRMFELLAKGHKQADVLRLAGFADVSHFSRMVRGAFGVMPSAFFDRRIEIVVADR